MSLILENEERPILGYKLLQLSDGTHGIATLKMTPKSEVVATSYCVRYRGQPEEEAKAEHALYRASEALVLKIQSCPGTKIYMTGMSLKNDCFEYKIGQIVKEPLVRSNVPDGKGIHFFASEKFAKMWLALLR